MSTSAQLPPPPPGYQVDSGSTPPPPPGYKVDAQAAFQQPFMGEIRAADKPTGIRDSITKWTDNVMNDIKYGTDITGVGTVLKKMGAHGVYSGNPEAVGDFMASLPLGLLRATKGGAEVTQSGQTWQGTKDIAGGALQAATIPAGFIAPEAGEAAAAVPGKITGAIAGRVLPSVMKQRAGDLFAAVAEDANKIPVSLDNAEQSALRLMDWQRKAQLGPTINKFLNRITSPKMGALTYEEARDYYSLLGRLSADEASKLPPVVQRELQGMVSGLKQDVGNAAEQVGRGADYYQAMGDYARAARLSEAYQTLKKLALPAALGAAGYKAYHGLSDLMSGR